ncbi:type II secretion system secretin GspD [Acidovorax sp. SDU_ACID1]|uniref:type II secretion system secretin GspD n=1 Tax=Acidovorax sp. SDU_ACID1 TaxID=3136632 RepID=UPI003872C498
MNIRPSILMLALLAVGCASTNGVPSADEAVQVSPSAISPLPAKQAVAAAPQLATQSGAQQAQAEPASTKAHLFPGNDNQFKPDLKPKIDPMLARGDKVSLNFENISVANLAEALLGDLLKLNYTIDAGGDAVVSLHTRQPLPRSQVLEVLDAVLLPHDLVINRDNAGVYHVTKRSVTVGTRPIVGAARVKDLAGSGTVIVPLNHIAAAEMAKILAPLASREAITYVDSIRNLLVLQGSKSQISGWLEMVEAFDVDFLAGMSLGVFVLENANVSVVNEALQAMLGSDGTGSSPFGGSGGSPASPRTGGSSAPRPGVGGSVVANPAANSPVITSASAGPLSGLIRLFPVERLNALVVVTPRSHILQQVETWIRRLDKPTDGLEHSLFVYSVQNGSAVKMAEMLNGLFGAGGAGGVGGVAAGSAPSQFGSSRSSGIFGSGQQTSMGNNQSNNSFGSLGTLGTGAQTNNATAAPATSVSTLEGNVRIVADASRNALMIRAPRAEYRRIERALRELDRAPTQVLIEASIVEVSLNGNLKYGVEWFIENHMSGDRTGQASLLNSNNSSGNIGTKQPGFSYTILNKAGAVRATLNALAANSQLKVLSSPSVLVLDNHSASIMVGRQQPIKTSTTIASTGGFATENITYKDTGVVLNVTPSVNASGLITLDILQQVTDVGEEDTATRQRYFLARQIQTRVAVRSGEPIVLGGVISENETAGNNGVPGLRNIPLLGALFSTSESTSARTELLVMLTPRVLEDDDALRSASAEMRDRLRGLTTQTNLTPLPQLDPPRSVPPSFKDAISPLAAP